MHFQGSDGGQSIVHPMKMAKPQGGTVISMGSIGILLSPVKSAAHSLES